MERQYIGARYVPVFFENPNTGDSTWLSGVAYEALTIVTFAGNNYTSKKPVPAGIGSPNLHPEYWVSTGNYNAQIEKVREEITDVREGLEELESKFPVKPNDIAHKQYILIADSFGNPTTVGGHPWIYWFEHLAGVTEGETAFSRFSGSGGFVRSGSNGTYLDLLTDITTSGDVADPNAITDIVVQTAGNDWESTGEQIKNGLLAFCNYAHQHYPNAKISIAVTHKFSEGNINTSIKVRYTVIPALINNTFIGYHYITNSEYIMQPLATTDGVHPDQYNSELIAGQIFSGVIGGSVSVTLRNTVQATMLLTGADSIELTREMKNNIINVFSARDYAQAEFLLLNSTGSPLTGYSYFNGLVVATLPTSFVRPASAPAMPTFLWIHTTDGEDLSVPAMMVLATDTTNNIVNIKIKTGYFKTNKQAISIDSMSMNKTNFSGPTEWML